MMRTPIAARTGVRVFALIILLLVVLAGGVIIRNNRNVSEDYSRYMKITSSAFTHNSSIPKKYTCDGENINPPLEISDIPKEAKSLVLIVDDPDAPSGLWVHWTAWDIPSTTSTIFEHTAPMGATEGVTNFGRPGYGGAGP